MTGFPRVGFLGLGIMGSRMAANLHAAGVPLTVWTHTPGKAAAWAADRPGVEVANSPAALGAAVDVAISILVDGAQVAATLTGPDGLALAATPGTLCVDMSTIAPGDARRIGADLARRDIAFVDAPVTGSSPKAEAGTLTIMCGGADVDVARAQPLFDVMGERTVHVGALGQGQAVKVITNAMAAANAATLAQGLLAADAAGADLERFLEVASFSAGGSTMVTLKGEPMRTHDFTPLFKLAHMLKDVRLALAEAGEAGVPFPAAAAAGEALTAAAARGLGDADFAAVLEAFEGYAGRRLGGDSPV
jgi:3-hydroxyisobutyrate dehydrogenase